jgi:hypothetical protein
MVMENSSQLTAIVLVEPREVGIVLQRYAVAQTNYTSDHPLNPFFLRPFACWTNLDQSLGTFFLDRTGPCDFR